MKITEEQKQEVETWCRGNLHKPCPHLDIEHLRMVDITSTAEGKMRFFLHDKQNRSVVLELSFLIGQKLKRRLLALEQQHETQRLIASLEQWLFLVASRNHPTLIREVEDIRNVSWGTAPTDWGKHFRDGKLRIETFFYTPTRYLLSVDPKVSHAVMTYLALTEQPNYGKGAGYASDELPAWYIDGMPEPPLLGEDPSETNL